MSKRNREKRAWKCCGCGARMHRSLEGPAVAKMAAVARESGRKPMPIAHACGACKTLHYAEGGRLRKLTAAELFTLQMNAPRAMADLETRIVPPSDATRGTLVIETK